MPISGFLAFIPTIVNIISFQNIAESQLADVKDLIVTSVAEYIVDWPTTKDTDYSFTKPVVPAAELVSIVLAA